MSIFSSLRKSRQQAKEHKVKLAEQKKKEEELAPYKHVPTHAATDAFASAPPSWRESYRPQILEQNRRRSAMAASGYNMNMPGPGGPNPGVPRVGSSLSHVTYPGENAGPTVRLPRAHSYTSVSPYERGRESGYTTPDITYLHPMSLKGKETPRGYESQRISPASSKGDPSPVESSSGSSSSQDELELRSTRPAKRMSGSTHRLHPSHSRRTSEASMNGHALSTNSRAVPPHGMTGTMRDSRPPPSMRGFASLPAVAAIPPMDLASLPGPLPPHVLPGNETRISSSRPGYYGSQQSSSASLSGMAKSSVTADTTPKDASEDPVEQNPTAIHPPNDEISAFMPTDVVSTPNETVESSVPLPSVGPETTINSKRMSREQQFAQSYRMPQSSSETQRPYHGHERMDRSRVAPVAHEDLVNVFPEVANDVPVANKGKRLSKGGGKLVKKKHRWSLSKAPAVTV